jgi:hypothetical protein
LCIFLEKLGVFRTLSRQIARESILETRVFAEGIGDKNPRTMFRIMLQHKGTRMANPPSPKFEPY